MDLIEKYTYKTYGLEYRPMFVNDYLLVLQISKIQKYNKSIFSRLKSNKIYLERRLVQITNILAPSDMNSQTIAAILDVPIQKLKDFNTVRKAFRTQILRPQISSNKQSRIKLNRAYEYACAQIFQTEVSKFHEFIIDANIPQVQKMLNGNKNLLDKCINQYPPIYHAVRCGHDDVTEFFLKAGCSMGFKDHKSTPMHCAVYYGYASIVPLLFAYGMPTDIKNKSDHYPIEQAANDVIKQMLQKMKVDHIYKLQKDLLSADLSHFSINIKDKKTNKNVITKLIHKNYNDFHNNPQYDRAFHGTLLSSAQSIMKFGLKKPGDQLQDRVLKVCDGHIKLDREEQKCFRGVENWQIAVFLTPSIYYASNPVYSKEFTNNCNEVWLTIFEVRVKKNTYKGYEHTVGIYKHEQNQPTNLQLRVEDPDNIKIVSVMLVNKEFIRDNRDYNQITDLIFDSKEEKQFRKYMNK